MANIDKNNAIRKKAKRKYIGNATKFALVNVKNSPLHESYKKSFICVNNINFDIEKRQFTSLYCGQRWCPTCSSIRTAKFIDKYGEELDKYDDYRFVTLTVKSDYIKAEDLDNKLKEMIANFSKINDLAKKQVKRGQLDIWHGIRKVECTYRDNGTFHPHFHLLVRTQKTAEFVVNNWLRLNPTSTIDGQKIDKTDKDIKHELFKYYTKILSSSSKGVKTSNRGINAIALDSVMVAMRGKKVFQSFGSMRKIEKDDIEDVGELISDNYMKTRIDDGEYWSWHKYDWYSENGVSLTNYKPSETFKQLLYGDKENKSI